MKRSLVFVKRYIRFCPWYILAYPFFYFSSTATTPIWFLSQQELVDRLKRGKSLIRFGDGEINFFIGLGNPYQRFDNRIRTMLMRIVRSYGPKSDYILAVSQPISLPNCELEKLGRKNVWIPFKIIFRYFFPHNVGYADTHQFYYDDYFESVIAPIFQDHHVVLVTRAETIATQQANVRLPWKSMSSVEAPSGDALTTYSILKEQIYAHLHEYDRSSTVLFFAVGPAGKYLMFELAGDGWQCLDVGKRAEVMFAGDSIEYLI